MHGCEAALSAPGGASSISDVSESDDCEDTEVEDPGDPEPWLEPSRSYLGVEIMLLSLVIEPGEVGAEDDAIDPMLSEPDAATCAR